MSTQRRLDIGDRNNPVAKHRFGDDPEAVAVWLSNGNVVAQASRDEEPYHVQTLADHGGSIFYPRQERAARRAIGAYCDRQNSAEPYAFRR